MICGSRIPSTFSFGWHQHVVLSIMLLLQVSLWLTIDTSQMWGMSVWHYYSLLNNNIDSCFLGAKCQLEMWTLAFLVWYFLFLLRGHYAHAVVLQTYNITHLCSAESVLLLNLPVYKFKGNNLLSYLFFTDILIFKQVMIIF